MTRLKIFLTALLGSVLIEIANLAETIVAGCLVVNETLADTVDNEYPAEGSWTANLRSRWVEYEQGLLVVELKNEIQELT